MPKVIKPDQVVRTDGVVRIPDGNAPVPQGDGLSPEGVLPSGEGGVPQALLSEEELYAKQLLLDARRERDDILAAAYAEADELRRQARQEGYTEAYNELREQTQSRVAEVDRLLEAMQTEQCAYLWEYEKELKGLALTVAEKVLNKALAEDQMALQDLVRQAVLNIKHVDWLSIEVSERLPQLISWLEHDFSPQFGNREIEVSGKDVPIDSVVLQTVDGVVDASVSTQLDNIRELFARME